MKVFQRIIREAALVWLLFCPLLLRGQEISLTLRSVPISKALTEIQKASGYSIVVKSDDLDISRKVSLTLENESVQSAISRVFAPQSVDITVSGTNISVSRKHVPTPPPAAVASPTVKGMVRDENGEPLMSAAVQVKGHGNQGVITGLDGEYEIEASASDILVFSFVGYRTYEVPVKGRKVLNVTLEPDTEFLEATVVVGYGVQKKGTLTGSIASINQNSLKQAPVDNLNNLLGGKLPGLVSRQTTGLPGENEASVYIRGISTTGTSTPLILVDGVERDFSNLDPSEIADITILKDAASAAVYGVKGANGVILVTTRRGDDAKPVLTYNGAMTFSTNADMLDLLNGPEYVYWHNLATDLDGVAREYNEREAGYVSNGGDPQGIFGNTDWKKLIFKDFAFGHNHNVSISGGNRTARYFVGGNLLSQDGIIDNVWFKRYNLRSNLDINLTEGLTLKFDLSGRIERRHQPGVSAGSSDPTASLDNGGAEYGYKNIVFYTISARPTTRPQLPDGQYIGYMNPLIARDESGFNDKSAYYVQSSVSLEYRFPKVKGLSARAMGSYDFRSTLQKHLMLPFSQVTPQYGSSDGIGGVILTPGNSPHLSAGINSLTESHALFGRYTVQAQLNYDRTFGKHDVGGDVVWEQSGTHYRTFSASRQKFVITEIPDLDFGGEITPNSSKGNHSLTGRQGLLFRGNYAFDQRYLFQASVRMDWSAKFSKEHRLGVFPAVSAGWRISEEPFMSSSRNWLDNLKLRASWGMLGNDSISDFLYVQGVGLTKNPDVVIGTQPAQSIYTTSIPNSDITWETTTTVNAGLDLSMWNGKLSFEGDVFYKVTRDILQSRAGEFPPSIGGNYSAIVNKGIVDVRGFEIVLGHRNRAGDFVYGISANLSYAANRYVSTNDSDNIPSYQSKVGQPLGAVLGYVSEGLFQTEEELLSSPKTSDAVRLGDIKYKDLNGDGKITTDDRTWIARAQLPKMMFGANFDFSWKGLGLTLFFQGAAMTDIMLCGMYSALSFSDGTYYTQSFKWGSNPPKYLVEGSWRPDHPEASYPRLSTASSSNNAIASDFWRRDASYLRLKNLNLSYTLPSRWTRKAHLDNVKVYFTATNVLTLSRLKQLGIDPEAPSVNNGYYPQQRTFSLGLNFSF